MINIKKKIQCKVKMHMLMIYDYILMNHVNSVAPLFCEEGGGGGKFYHKESAVKKQQL